jgi:enamine deaminase RidA (YjgF/YER057c/UK114 family)
MKTEIDLTNLEMVLPPAPKPLGQYAALSEANGFAFLSGMLPVRDGTPAFTGFGDKHQSREAARLAALNALAVLRAHFGTLDKIERVVRVGVFIAAAPDFSDHAFVADGCSEIFNLVFPKSEKHARLAFGVSSLPLNASVELELIFQLAEERV